MKLKDFLDSKSEEELIELINYLKNNSSQRVLQIYPCLTKKNYISLCTKYKVSPIKHTMKWYINGEEDKFVFDDYVLSTSWVEGRSECINVSSNYCWITNDKDDKYILKSSPLPIGFHYGKSQNANLGKVLYNNGERSEFFEKENVPEGYVKGTLNKDNYKESASKRKLITYNNGMEEIRLTIDKEVPKDFVIGKLNNEQKISIRDAHFEELGYIPIKDLSTQQKSAYQYYRDILHYSFDKIDKKDTYTYINKKHLSMLNDYCATNHSKGTSNKEHDLVKYIKSIYKGNVFTNVKNVIKDKDGFYELDVYIPDKNLAIEFNGTFWHCNLNKSKNYHFNKSYLCEQLGIRLIHIFEYEWDNPMIQEKIKLMLNIALDHISHKIYARQCKVMQISNKEAKELNNKIHLQGHRNAQVTYGLFYNNELVQLMSFSRTRYNRNLKESNSWEIIRGCPGSNNVVIGGVSKLFSHFVKDYNPSQIFSYCDFNKFNGVSYEKLGMKFIGYTSPDMKWVLKDRSVHNRLPSKHKEFSENSFAKIYGAGSKKYLWVQKK